MTRFFGSQRSSMNDDIHPMECIENKHNRGSGAGDPKSKRHTISECSPIMKRHGQLLLVGLFLIGMFTSTIHAEDGTPRELTEPAKKTLEILRTEKLDTITLDPREPQKGFELLKAKLANRGVTVRLKHNGDPKSKHAPDGPLALRNIPLGEFMRHFDQWAWWGWILYPDGSITYFDYQCACTWPKDGLYYHDSQYEEGKPELKVREQKAASEKTREEQ